MTRAVVALLCLAGAAIQAQTPARDASALVTVPTGTGSLSGVVVDGENHPLRRVQVSISGDMRVNRSAITDDAGRFVFPRLPKGRFTITAAKAGYPDMSYGAKRPYRAGSGVSLAEGQAVNGLVLKLSRGAVLTGTVFDDKGQAMSGVPVMAWAVRTTLAGERTLDFAPNSGNGIITDDRGMYRVYGLPPGDFTIGTAWFYSGGSAAVRVPTEAETQAAFLAVTQTGGPATQAGAAPPAATARSRTSSTQRGPPARRSRASTSPSRASAVGGRRCGSCSSRAKGRSPLAPERSDCSRA